MLKKSFAVLIALVLVFSLAACGEKKSAYDTVKAGAAKVAEAESYEYEGSMTLQLEGAENLSEDPSAAEVAKLLNNAELKYKGVYNKKTEQQSLTLDLAIKGDMSFNFTIPFIVNKNELYVKIPKIPFLPLPDDVVGKYLHITDADLKELGEDAPSLNTDKAKQEALSKEIMGVFAKHFKDDKNLVKVDAKKSTETKPENVKELVEYNVTNENVQEVVTKLAKNVLPDMLAVLSKAEYKEMTGVDENAVKEYNDALKDFDNGMTEFKKAVDVKEAKTLLGVDNKGYLSYLKEKVNVNVKDPDKADAKPVGFGITLDVNMKNFDAETPAITIPEKKDTLTLKEAEEKLGGLFGGPTEEFPLEEGGEQ